MNNIIWHPEAIRTMLRDRRVERRLDELAEMVADRARARVRVESGALRDSIRTEITKDEEGVPLARVIAGNDEAFYAHFVELGTERSRPRPFLRPALAYIRRGAGGKDSGLRVKRDKAASRTSARNRRLARERAQ